VSAWVHFWSGANRGGIRGVSGVELDSNRDESPAIDLHPQRLMVTEANMANSGKDGDGAPKIIVDSDWKAQAQAEKEKLSEVEEQAAAAGGDRGLPPADFQSIVGTLFSQALMYLGGMADPKTGAAMVDLEAGKHFIDLLGVLDEKTKGNLDEQEAELMKQALAEARGMFVEISRAIEQQMAKRAGGGAATGGKGPIIQ